MKKLITILLLLLIFIQADIVTAARTIPSAVKPNLSINVSNQTNQSLKVLVVVIDPILTSITDKSLYPNNNGHPRVSEWFGQSVPKSISSVLTDYADVSHGYFTPSVVKTEYLNEYPRYTFQVNLLNGSKSYSYDEASYIEMGKADSSGKTGDWYKLFSHPLFKQGGDSACVYDYEYLINKLDLINRRNRNEFDQVWVFSVSPMGFCEGMMIGRTAFDINGTPIIKDCPNFVLMGWEIARPDTMMHSFGHVVERLMKRVYGETVPDLYGKDVYNVNTKTDYNKLNYWEKFALNSYNNKGTLASVGDTHFPFNANENYGYYNTGYVQSNWKEWLNYPNVPGDKFESVNNSTFMNSEINRKLINNPDGVYTGEDRMWQRFWMNLMPHINGYTTDGYSNNWWKYFWSLDYAVEVYNNYGTTTINAFKGDMVESDYVVYFYSGNADRLQTINEDNNVVISNSSVVGFKDGKLYGKNTGTSTVKISYDGHPISYTVSVKEPKTKKYSLNTTANNLGISVGSGSAIKVYNNNATVRKTDSALATSDRIYVYTNGRKSDLYNVIVTGDVTGSGSVSVSDVAKLYQYLKEKITMDDIYVQAGNVVSSDSVIKINDVAKLYQFVKHKINSL